MGKSIIWLGVRLEERVKKKIPEMEPKSTASSNQQPNLPLCHITLSPNAEETQTGGSSIS